MRISLPLLAASLALCAGTVAAQTATTPPAKAPAADSTKMKCKSHTETGSLAHVIRECHTIAEWNALARQGRTDAEYYQQVMNSSRAQ